MGRVPENLTRPEGFLAAQTQPEPKKTFANPKNPKITNFIYLKTRNKPEKRLENPTQTWKIFQNPNPTQTRHLATRPITAWAAICSLNSYLLHHKLIILIIKSRWLSSILFCCYIGHVLSLSHLNKCDLKKNHRYLGPLLNLLSKS